METPYRRLLGAATVTGVLDAIDFNHPKAALRLHHAITYLRRENEIRSALYEHSRQMGLLQIMASLPSGRSHMGELIRLEEKQHEYIQELMLGKTPSRSPVKLAKQWTEAWNKAFGDQDDPAVKAKIEAAAAALLQKR